jgi:hypothetical protein
MKFIYIAPSEFLSFGSAVFWITYIIWEYWYLPSFKAVSFSNRRLPLHQWAWSRQEGNFRQTLKARADAFSVFPPPLHLPDWPGGPISRNSGTGVFRLGSLSWGRCSPSSCLILTRMISQKLFPTPRFHFNILVLPWFHYFLHVALILKVPGALFLQKMRVCIVACSQNPSSK